MWDKCGNYISGSKNKWDKDRTTYFRKGAGSSSHVTADHPVHSACSLELQEHPPPFCSQFTISWRLFLTPEWPVTPSFHPQLLRHSMSCPRLQLPLTHQSPSLGFEQTQGKGSILIFRGPAPGFLTGAQQSLQDKPVPNSRAIIPRQENWDSDAYLEGNKSHPQLRVPRVLPNLPVKLLHPGLEEHALSVGL